MALDTHNNLMKLGGSLGTVGKEGGYHFCTPDDVLVERNILSFLYTNSISVILYTSL
jgi:hypothetical protein